MAIGMLLVGIGGAQAYDGINREMGMSEQTLPDGLISHHAGPADNGDWVVFDVWESRDAFDRFAQDRLMPAVNKVLGDAAGQMRPSFVEIYNEWHGKG